MPTGALKTIITHQAIIYQEDQLDNFLKEKTNSWWPTLPHFPAKDGEGAIELWLQLALWGPFRRQSCHPRKPFLHGASKIVIGGLLTMATWKSQQVITHLSCLPRNVELHCVPKWLSACQAAVEELWQTLWQLSTPLCLSKGRNPSFLSWPKHSSQIDAGCHSRRCGNFPGCTCWISGMRDR